MKDEKGGETFPEFVFGVPSTEEVDHAREEDGFGDTEKDADNQEAVVGFDRSGACTYGPPNCRCGTNVLTQETYLVSKTPASLAVLLKNYLGR